MNNYARVQVVCKQLTLRNCVNQYIISWLLWSTEWYCNAQQHFVYSKFIAIPQKAFQVSFCKERKSEILYNHLYKKLALSTKKSYICQCDFYCIVLSVSRYSELLYQFPKFLRYNMPSMYHQKIRCYWLKYCNLYQLKNIKARF